MATIRAYTTIEQSKKLTEILPLESADMYYIAKPDSTNSNMIPSNICIPRKTYLDGQAYGEFCAWSLTALLGVLPEIDDTSLILEKVKAEDWYEGYYYHIEYKDKILIPYSKNPIDACVSMIEKLNEFNLL